MVAELGKVTLPVEVQLTNGTDEYRKAKIDSALQELVLILRQGTDGGFRVQAREALARLFDAGLTAGLWEPTDAPPTTSEATGRARVAGHVHERAEKATESQDDAVSALRGWWEQTAHDEIAQLTAKMVEYGGLSRATDLTEIGRHLTEVGVPEGPLLGNGQVQEGWLQELGIYFYLVGKFSRWSAAIQEGRPVSDDTLLDIGIYVRMAQRVRAVGGWPV